MLGHSYGQVDHSYDKLKQCSVVFGWSRGERSKDTCKNDSILLIITQN